MVGTSNLGSWNGHWSNGLYKSATKNIRLFFLTKMFHGQWPLMPIVDLWKKEPLAAYYIYIYQFTCSIIFIYWFIPPFMATCCKVLCKYHITRTWQAVYPVVFILRIGPMVAPNHPRPDQFNPEKKETSISRSKNTKHYIYLYLIISSWNIYIYVNQYVITDLLLW